MHLLRGAGYGWLAGSGRKYPLAGPECFNRFSKLAHGKSEYIKRSMVVSALHIYTLEKYARVLRMARVVGTADRIRTGANSIHERSKMDMFLNRDNDFFVHGLVEMVVETGYKVPECNWASISVLDEDPLVLESVRSYGVGIGLVDVRAGDTGDSDWWFCNRFLRDRVEVKGNADLFAVLVEAILHLNFTSVSEDVPAEASE
jgi:hypothetical protein